MRLVTIWHDEPGGADSGTVCSYAAAKRHPQHWTLQWHHWQKIRRTLFTRCEWCGGPSRTGDRVNISRQWWGAWQLGEGPDPEGYVMDHCASAIRAALADSDADTGEQEAGHRCEPYYSRSQCGQCGWQEQWCATCSRQMCGCATETTDQEDQA
jgi:hypothetical protein